MTTPDDTRRADRDTSLSSAPRISWGVNSPLMAAFAIVIFLVSAIALIRIFGAHQLDPRRDVPVAFVLIVAFAMSASFLAAIRGGATLDLEKRQLVRWWGPMFPLKVVRIPFDSIRWIRIGEGLGPGSPKPARRHLRWYHVAVHTEKDQWVIRLSKSHEDVRFHARRVANAVGCSVEDCTT